MAKDFLRFVPRPADLAKALKRIALGGLVASSGLSVPIQAATAQTTLTPTIVDRSKKAAKVLLRLPGTAANYVSQHRSHSSHSSHSSHVSGSSGRSAPVYTPPPSAPSRPSTPVTSAGVLPAPGATNTVSIAGEIQSIDATHRTFVFKQSTAVSRNVAYRDDTKFQTDAGSSVRFDDFASLSKGQLPISKGDKVEVTWRMSADGSTPVATIIRRK